MGLLYQFPRSEKEIPFFLKGQDKDGNFKRLSTYGLPMLFWGYFLAALTVLAIMYLLIFSPLQKMVNGTDSINIALGWTVHLFFLGLPLITLGFLFFEKQIYRYPKKIVIVHKVFGLPYWRKTFPLNEAGPHFEVKHYMGSPNIAKMKGETKMRGFQNHGYYQLFLTDNKGLTHLIDRSSQKNLIDKVKELLS